MRNSASDQRPTLSRAASLAIALSLLGPLGCEGAGLPTGLHPTPEGGGPQILWDLYHEPLPDIPLPNDVATWPDPTRATGRRLNASMLVSTDFEQNIRELFDGLDGWGTFAPISIPFDAEIDIADLMQRQGGADNFHASDFPEHAIYVVNMETGIPALLDLNGGNFYYTVSHLDQYWENDPRFGESNLLFETVEEDINGNGVLDPGEDTDFDGVLDHPNTLNGTLSGAPLETFDEMAWFYERETNTLVLRPILPLDQRTTYAVVVTDRLRGMGGEAVRSPFDEVHHLRQIDALRDLPGHFADHPELYGDLATRGWDGVAFAWTFTTQSVTADMDTIRDGLYGRGVMSYLADDFPTDIVPMPMQNSATSSACEDDHRTVYVADGERFRVLLRTLASQVFELDEASTEIYMRTWESLDHVVLFFYDTPFFFEDPDNEQLADAFVIDHMTGEARVTNEAISAMVFVPRETELHAQPFDTTFYVHGHGSNNAEALLFGGMMMQHGIAVALANANGHGLELDAGMQLLLRSFFREQCIQPALQGLIAGRARDLDHDGTLDSGAHFWTASVFHTRDSVRQTVIDHMQAIRILRSFDGRPAGPRTLHQSLLGEIEFDGDFDGDGTPDVAGDFDGDGTPDFGGPDAQYHFTGGSLGGITSGMFAGVEPAITTSAPIVGAGGLSDVAIRTENGAVLPAMILRLMGPLVMGRVSEGPSVSSACAAGETSLYFLATSLTKARRTEFACVPESFGDESVMIVRNVDADEVRCGGVTGGPGQFRVPIPSDAGDHLLVELYESGRAEMDFGDCSFSGAARAPDRVVSTFEVGNGTGTGSCAQCARFEDRAWDAGDALVSVADGFGRRRQTPELRRLVMLAQIALDGGDPINYARRVFLQPREVPDVEVASNNLLVVQTIGDQNVCLATGNAYARAAGILPFLPPDAPDEYADWRAPASFEARYGATTPNDLLIQDHVLEGLPYLNRHPVTGADDFLADVDDLSEGRLFFSPDGGAQMHRSEGGLRPFTQSPPLRWTRLMRPMTGPTDDVWTYVDGADVGGLLNVHVIPRGIHGFNELYSDAIPFDIAMYTFNLIAHYMATGGRDLYYRSHPADHHCLEDSSCDFISRP